MGLHLLEMHPPNRADIHMPSIELRHHRGQMLRRLLLAERQRPANDIHHARGIRGDKRADQHPGVVGTDDDPGGVNAQAAHERGSETSTASARVSSANER